MSYVRNFRVDPFNAVTQYKTITEYHVVPATAPYQIKLGEVPAIEDPSSLTVKYSNGTPLTEVANLPSKGEFFPDYLSDFSSSKSPYNTGTLLFNVGDIDQVLTITYKATGSVIQASANRPPEWMYSRGSGALGNVRITENTTLSGIYNYESLIINPGVTVTVNGYCVIRCCEAFINYGTIRATNTINPPKAWSGGMGKWSSAYSATYLGGNGFCYTEERSTDKGLGRTKEAWRGTSGGDSIAYPTLAYYGGDTYSNYGSIENYMDSSSGIPRIMGMPGLQGGVLQTIREYEGSSSFDRCFYGGYGGYGGGSIAVLAKEIYNQGTLNSSGTNGSNAPGTWYQGSGGWYNVVGGGGGGDGGSIILSGWSISNRGSLLVNGGSGGDWTRYGDRISTGDCVGGTGYSGIILTYTNPYGF